MKKRALTFVMVLILLTMNVAITKAEEGIDTNTDIFTVQTISGNDMEIAEEKIDVASDLVHKSSSDLHNPIHHCSSNDYTVWDYVYFGYYPQSKVENEDLISQLDQKALDLGITEGDFELNGVKYRMFTDFDSELKKDVNTYFIWEKIKWKVLSAENDKLFLFADVGLDYQVFNEGTQEDGTWENSFLRQWLNKDFYNNAFTEEEQQSICLTHLTAPGSKVSISVTGGNDTDDKIFILTSDDVTNESYGFCKEAGSFRTDSTYPVRIFKATPYVDFIDGSTVRTDLITNWVLRSPGAASYDDNFPELEEVCYDGVLSQQSYSFYKQTIFPALYIDINGSYESIINNENGTALPGNPTHHCSEKEDYGEYSYVYFGSYPQSLVTDEKELAKVMNNSEIKKQVELGGGGKEFPKGILIDNYKYAVQNKKVYKYEKIKWRVLSIEEDKILLQADNVLGFCAYSSRNYGESPWVESRLRDYLNDDFIKEAFTKDEKQIICDTRLDNGSDEPTIDKVFILSPGDVLNEDYGFCSKPFNPSGSRNLKATEYSLENSYIKRSDMQTPWWLRTPAYEGHSQVYIKVSTIDDSGAFYGESAGDSGNYYGFVPAITIDRNSSLWSTQKSDAVFESSNSTETGGIHGGNSSANTTSNLVKVQQIAISGISSKVAAGKKISLKAAVLPETADNRVVIWSTDNDKYADVSTDGIVTTKKAGAGKSVTIQATAADGSGIVATYKINIMKCAVTKVSLSAKTKSVKAGKKLTVKAKVATTGKNVNKTLKWTSSNTKYATVNSKGVVKTKKEGKGKTVTITAQSTDGTNKKAKIKIKIK